MQKSFNTYLEYREEIPDSILDFKGLKKSIVEFKNDKALEVLMNFYEKEWTSDNNKKCYSRFNPLGLKDQETETGTHNIGIFSTALCLETLAAYVKNVDECKKNFGEFQEWKKECCQRIRARDRRKESIQFDFEERRTNSDRRKLENMNYGKYSSYRFFNFIIDGLSGDLGAELGFLARIATLVRFGNFLHHLGNKETFLNKVNEETQIKFKKICIECICDFQHRFSTRREGIHPFELYRFLQFVSIWGSELYCFIDDIDDIKETLQTQCKHNYLETISCLKTPIKNRDSIIDNGKRVFHFFFDEVYLFAKYELYRQLSLKQSGDIRLYDAKRLIYALLVVYLDNRFSNTLIRNKALDLIFSPLKEDRNASLPTGQQVAMSKDGLMIVSDNECFCDLLGCYHLKESLLKYVIQLKYVYDSYTRTKRVVNREITGWYPVHQRTQNPTSWTTALTLSFIKKFCQLVSLELSKKAKRKFRSNYRKPEIEWSDIYDCTAVKAKMRLMFPEGYSRENREKYSENIIEECKYRTAILFGPPGTGKTTYGRALATKLQIDYLELTPGDFFSGGENSILTTINDIFEHLLHLKDAVVFIDEIDDLVKERNPNSKEKEDNSKKIESYIVQPYDPRTLFVNSLLPRFQELHDKKNIILLMATNHIDRVDEAISRMGRVDLVIPVGAISPHGRLKYLEKIFKKNQTILCNLMNLNEDDLYILVVNYLNATEAFNYSTLKQYSEMILDEVKKNQNPEGEIIKSVILKLFNVEIGKKGQKNNRLLIWQDNVVDKDLGYNTRPKYDDGDFQDFGYFDSEYKKFPETKRRFQNGFIRLYHLLNHKNISSSSADEIYEIIIVYCNEFQLDEKELKKNEPFEGKLYNIMTPFYDDLSDAIEKVKNEEIKTKLIRSRSEIGKLIFNRPILPY